MSTQTVITNEAREACVVVQHTPNCLPQDLHVSAHECYADFWRRFAAVLIDLVILNAIALAIVTATAYGADLSQRIATPSGIVVHLPAGWQQIPKDVLIAQFAEAARQNPNLPKQTYEYGFQAPSREWFAYPYLLVQIQRTGRIPEVALKKMPNLDEMMASKMQEFAEAASATVNASMGKTVYDPINRILWTSARMNYAGVGDIQMLAGGHLSEDGCVQVFGYVREEDFPRYEAVIHDIISSVELPDYMRYVPRATDNILLVHAIDWDKVLSKGIGGAVAGGIAALIIGLTRRKKKDSQPEN